MITSRETTPKALKGECYYDFPFTAKIPDDIHETFSIAIYLGRTQPNPGSKQTLYFPLPLYPGVFSDIEIYFSEIYRIGVILCLEHSQDLFPSIIQLEASHELRLAVSDHIDISRF